MEAGSMFTMFNPTSPSSGNVQISALYVYKENTIVLNTSLIILSNT